MRRALLALSCLALVVVGALVIGAGLGLADAGTYLEGKRPTPTPDRAVVPGAQAAPDIPSLPDLVVESIEVQPPAPLISEPVVIKITIKNQGSAPVRVDPANNFWTDLYIDPAVVPIQLGQDGEIDWGCQAWWMEAGGSWTVQGAYVFTDVKSYALYAQVDTDNDVGESNENNNVYGPVSVEVRAPNKLVHESHEDFQFGLASNLDVTHPDGVIRRGNWRQPLTNTVPTIDEIEIAVYTPDTMINDVTGTLDANGDLISTMAYQANPVLVGDGQGGLYAVWEDSRGGYYHRNVMFSRSGDGGIEWADDFTITEGITGMQVMPDLAYDAEARRVYVAWQDSRNGPDDFDIFFAYYDIDLDTWSTSKKVNDGRSTGHQMNPSIGLAPMQLGVDRKIYVVWQDQRNGNDDVYLAWSDDLDDPVDPWNGDFFVTDDAEGTWQDQRSPSVGVNERGEVFACWEDWRWAQKIPGDTPEIYCARSFDSGQTFGIDVPMNTDAPLEWGKMHRVEPTMVVSTSIELKEEWDPEEEVTISVPIEITAIHVAFQQGQGEEADIYWGYSVINHTDPYFCPYPYSFCFKPPIEVSGFVMDSEYALPPDSGPTWPAANTWQGQVSISLAPPHDYTMCHADSTSVYSNGLYFAWSDSRTYDDWRYEIRTRRAASPEGDPETFEICEDWAVGVVNDNAKLYAYRNDLDQYEIYGPAATGQRNPSVVRDRLGLYVAWDDDRWDKPMEAGTVRNRDVFMASAGLTPEAIYISEVIDGGPSATWYALSWWGVTQNSGDLLLQTRLGEDPYPPQGNIETATWTKWAGNPSSLSVGCSAGKDCYYDAPGRHIVDSDGKSWPKSRYIQYKITMRGNSAFTALSRVTLHYKGTYVRYLPSVPKDAQ